MKCDIVLSRFIAIYLVTLRPIYNEDNLMQNYGEMMNEANKYMSTIDLKRESVGVKESVLSVPFSDETEEACLFKCCRPALTRRLLFY